MAQNLYAPLITQIHADAPHVGRIRRLFSHLFAQKRYGQLDGLTMLEQDVNRIRLQSRHWLM